tara:strand:+ start:323 stop:964 length:642 start_codon:yes stop_codon:yes gene_type:complete
MDTLFIAILIFLIVLIIYLIIQLYTRYKNDSINKEYTPKPIHKHTESQPVTNSGKRNILFTLSHKTKIYELEIELFNTDLPITCKNFRHMCFNGLHNKTYKNACFDKVIKGRFIQLENIFSDKKSIYGKNFRDESFKYKHSFPGVLSMVNTGQDTNNTEFFITTKSCPNLDGKNVVFGRVVKGLCHLFIIQNCIVDKDNKPEDEIKIIDIKEV